MQRGQRRKSDEITVQWLAQKIASFSESESKSNFGPGADWRIQKLSFLERMQKSETEKEFGGGLAFNPNSILPRKSDQINRRRKWERQKRKLFYDAPKGLPLAVFQVVFLFLCDVKNSAKRAGQFFARKERHPQKLQNFVRCNFLGQGRVCLHKFFFRRIKQNKRRYFLDPKMSPSFFGPTLSSLWGSLSSFDTFHGEHKNKWLYFLGCKSWLFT